MSRIIRGKAEQLVGRQGEMGMLLASLDDLQKGVTAKYVVTGEMGIGRTALLRHFAETARERGALAVVLRCLGDGRELASSLAAQLLLELGGEWPPGEPAMAELETVVRVLREEREVTLSESLPTLRRAIGRIAERAPLVITVDDLTVGDPGVPAVLSALTRTCPDTPTLLVMSCPEGLTAEYSAGLSELLFQSRSIDLQGLGVSDASLLVRKILGRAPDAETAAEMHRVCAGNPKLLSELALSLSSHQRNALGRTAVQQASLPAFAAGLMHRITRSNPDATKLIVATAVAGGSSDPRLLAHMSELDIQDSLRAMDSLIRMRLIADDGKLVLRHPLVRNSILAGMTSVARDAAHLKAATYLHRTHAPVERIAAQLTASSVPLDGSWPASVLLRAGRSALASGRESEAVNYLEDAVRVASGEERDQALVDLTDLRMRADGHTGIEKAISVLQETTRDSVRSRILSRLGCALFLRAPDRYHAKALALLDPIVAEAGMTDWLRLHQLMTKKTKYPPKRLASRLEQILLADSPQVAGCGGVPATPNRLGPGVAALDVFIRYLGGADPASSVRQADHLLAQDDALCVHPGFLMAALTVLMWNGRYDMAAHHVERHQNCEHGRGHTLQQTLLLSVRARIALAGGDLKGAARYFTDCLDGLTRIGTPFHNPVRAGVAGAFAGVLLDSGDHHAARKLLHDHRCLKALPQGWHFCEVLLSRSRLHAVTGDFSGALSDLEETRQRVESAGIAATALPWRTQGVTLMRQLGQPHKARQWADEQLRLAEKGGTRRARGISLRLVGGAAGGAAGEEALREAVALLEQEGARLHLAHALSDLGFQLAGETRWEEASDVLGKALCLADECGADPLAAHVRDRLAQLGGSSPRHAALRAAMELTAREKQTLIGALRGLSNEELATTLHITKRTVEIHLSNCYRKLNIRGRKEFGWIFHVPGLWPLLLDGAQAPV